MRLVLLADGAVGAKIASFLIESHPADLALIVTTQFNDIFLEAKGKGIPVCVFDSEINVLARLGGVVELGVMAWWPKILKNPLLDAPRRGFVNTHPSLLPYNRGKHYNFWALVEQAPFGVTLHLVDSGVDTGDIVAQAAIDYDWCATGETLYNLAQTSMVELFRKTYPSLRTGKFESKPQDSGTGSFHRSSELESASKIELDTHYRARDLLNLLRARTFVGHPGCWFEETGNRYEISINIIKLNNMNAHHKFKTECTAEISAMGENRAVAKVTNDWIQKANELKYSYHFEWQGRPIIQYPQDIVAMHELIWQIKPDLIIETGIAHGGSLIFSASQLAQLDMCDAIEAGTMLDPKYPKRMVLGIDIDIRPHNRAAIEVHPMASRIQMIQGSSIDPDIIAQVHAVAANYTRVLVCLDSNHTHEHVLAELQAYAHLTSVGSYCCVFDTIVEDMPADMFPDRPWRPGNNPKTAVCEYLKTHSEFEIDKSIQHKLLITVAPDGYLRRVA
jgi:cephalosporin hydroxylase